MNLLQRLGLSLLGLDLKLRATPTTSRGGAVHAASYEDGRAVQITWSTETAVNEGMKSLSWVYASVDRIQVNVASVRLVLEQKTADGWEALESHELQALLDRPNPFQGRRLFNSTWVQHMMLGGNAVAWMNMSGGKPRELWLIPPDQVRPIVSAVDFIGGYEWKVGSTKRTLAVGEVAHWLLPDPSNPRWGLSPLMAAAQAVDTDRAAATWNRKTLNNDGKPPYAVLLSDKLSVQQMQAASDLIREQVDGASIRQALVMGGTTRVQPLTLNATELDFLNGRRFSMQEIAAVFGVPPVLLLFGQEATYANADAAKTELWESRNVPLLDALCDGLEGKLFPYWGFTDATHRIRPDLSQVRALQANLKTEAEVKKLNAETFKIMVDSGVPANQAALAAGVPLVDIPGGDMPRQPQAQAPPSTKATPHPQRRKDKGDAEEVAKRLARAGSWEGKVLDKVVTLLQSQGQAAAAAYAAGNPWERELSPPEWKALLSALHEAVIETEGAIAYSAMLKKIASVGGGGTFDVLADGVVKWVQNHVGDSVKQITDTSKELLRAEIAAGVQLGEGQDKIAARLAGLADEWAGFRAHTIARTEVGAAFGAAHHESALQIQDLGVEMEKQWIATQDSRTRDEHAAMDGEIAPIDEPFSNGADSAPSGVNCRCVTIYRPKGGGE